MNLAFKSRLFTADEFNTLVSVGTFARDIGGVELHEGHLVKMNPKYLPHVGMQAALVYELTRILKAHHSSLCCVAEATLRLDDRNTREPDVAVYEPRDNMTTFLLPEAVRLIVEVAGDSLADDLSDKATLYARAGVPDYWVVNLAAKVTHVHRAPCAEGYGDQTIVRFEEELRSACLPDALVLAGL